MRVSFCFAEEPFSLSYAAFNCWIIPFHLSKESIVFLFQIICSLYQQPLDCIVVILLFPPYWSNTWYTEPSSALLSTAKASIPVTSGVRRSSLVHLPLVMRFSLPAAGRMQPWKPVQHLLSQTASGTSSCRWASPGSRLRDMPEVYLGVFSGVTVVRWENEARLGSGRRSPPTTQGAIFPTVSSHIGVRGYNLEITTSTSHLGACCPQEEGKNPGWSCCLLPRAIPGEDWRWALAATSAVSQYLDGSTQHLLLLCQLPQM